MEIVAYKKEHGAEAVAEKFDVHPTQVRRWERGEGLGKKRGPRRKAEVVAKEFGHTKGNGAAQPDPTLKAVLLHLERWKAGQRAHIRRGGVDNPYDISAEHAYRIARGEE